MPKNLKMPAFMAKNKPVIEPALKAKKQAWIAGEESNSFMIVSKLVNGQMQIRVKTPTGEGILTANPLELCLMGDFVEENL